ncbi:hypothetical protein [Sphingomonas rubra]|uniref:REase AHJR-like domain-containing protein n=1 Tax=Sphingomonas rubra TaxID=634430 RepID=A0A1I5UMW0_9SPHN|nr:hypothetical protein [Sphingomonas rubra]SFP96654.1 hypothetical protein SAMN04488241_11316 [Sphingomonas rubra]
MSAARHEESQAELDLIGSLRQQYEAKGFSFEVAPNRQDVPEFLGSYVPDAIARRGDEYVAIEVKKSRSRASELTLQQIRSRFEGQPNWKFAVAYVAEDPLKTLTIKSATVPAIRRQVDEVRTLAEQSHHRAAFLLAWSLLESTLLHIEAEQEARPRTPGSVLQALAMLGRIEPETERRLRPLILVRNAVVHGDLAVEPTAADVSLLVSAIEEALSDA